jgi:hypothetical protein
MEFPNIKNKRNLFKINFSNLVDFQKITEGLNFNINHGLLIMLVSSLVNPDPTITKERLCQDYI